jgi:DNA-binding LytR/AlgR family response regulator
LRLKQTAAPRTDLVALLKKLEQPKPSYLAWLNAGAGNTTRVLSVAEILYFRSASKYTDVVTATERHVIRKPLKELAQELDPDQFAQIHRGTIVNLRSIERIEHDLLGRLRVHLKGHDDVLLVSRTYARRFRQM